jgi:3-phosphoshikimate 1-carboxyvinyltransferase
MFSDMMKDGAIASATTPSTRQYRPFAGVTMNASGPRLRRATHVTAEKIERPRACHVPGDKSISHRALILGGGALASGRRSLRLADAASPVAGAVRWVFRRSMPDGAMVLATLAPEQTTPATRTTARQWRAGRGAPALPSTATLLRRPMAVAEPLARKGGSLANGNAPGHHRRGAHGIYQVPVPSAQVKSAILLAGLFAGGDTTVVESTPTRDHTEIMLDAMGAGLDRSDRTVTVHGGCRLEGIHVMVPGDFSSAAFFIVAALLVPGSHVHLPFTGVNPRRTGLLRVLESMGAAVRVDSIHDGAMDLTGDVSASFSDELHGVTVDDPETIASIIDEIPILAVAATRAHGRTNIRGAGELRHKESDRIASLAACLRALGARVEEFDDGLAIDGPAPLRGAALALR